MNVTLKNINDLYTIKIGESISKGNLMNLIIGSKVKGSKFWVDAENIVNNTPQQGINSIGKYPNIKGVILKTKKGAYDHDGWNESKSEFKYAFKAEKGVINYKAKANLALIEQPHKNYPLYLLVENRSNWDFMGKFYVSSIEKNHVVLKRLEDIKSEYTSEKLLFEDIFEEGERKLVSHYKSERNNNVVKYLKENKPNVCEICGIDFEVKFGFKYIEAHHKVPHSAIKGIREVKASDFALLCPNCHKVVHLYMSNTTLNYIDIARSLTM